MIFNGTDGNTRTGGLRELRFGDKRIREGYFGDTKIFFQPYVKIMFYFDRTNINPRNRFGTRPPLCGAEWRSTSDPHVWYVITPVYRMGVSDVDYTMGIGQLFCNRSGETGKLLESQVGTCQVTDIIGDVDCIANLDRTFKGCTAITSISQAFWERFRGSTALTNVGGMCANCTNITDGSSLYGYNLLHDTCPNITAHPDAFVNADSATNLAQIPTSWGGTMAPPATQLSCLKYNNAGWTVDTTDPNCPDFTTVASLNVFTTVSISQYSGVNMRKTNIWNKISPFVTTTATYYYPAFMQGTGAWPTGASSRFRPTWVFAPDNYNGMLPADQTTGDMPGILDHESLGPFSTKYGTFDSTKTTYFGFLVFNSDTDLATFDPNSTGYGIHSNSNFKDMTLNWFIPA